MEEKWPRYRREKWRSARRRTGSLFFTVGDEGSEVGGGVVLGLGAGSGVCERSSPELTGRKVALFGSD